MNTSTYRFESLLESDKIKVQYRKSKSTKKEHKKALKRFYTIVETYDHNGTPAECLVKEMSLLGEIVIFDNENKKIGTSNFNIPTQLTLESTSEEIGKEVARFREVRQTDGPKMII